MTNVPGFNGVAGAPQPRREEEFSTRARSPGVVEKALGVITAILVLTTTILGLVAKRSYDRNSDLSDAASDERAKNSALASQNADLKRQIANLQTAPTAEAQTQVSSSPSSSAVFHKSDHPVVLLKDQGIDLDNPAPDWGVTVSAGGGQQDLGLHYNSTTRKATLGTNSYEVDMSIVNKVPTAIDCSSPDLPHMGTLTAEETTVGTMLCVKTGQKRIAYVRIASGSAADLTVSLEITVWN